MEKEQVCNIEWFDAVEEEFEPIEEELYRIRFEKTVVGWWNVYLFHNGKQYAINVCPELFRMVFPHISDRTTSGCAEVYFEILMEFGLEGAVI